MFATTLTNFTAYNKCLTFFQLLATTIFDKILANRIAVKKIFELIVSVFVD